MNESETDQRKNGVRCMIQPASVLGVSSQATEMIALEQYGSKYFENDATRRWPCASMQVVHLDHITVSSGINCRFSGCSPSSSNGFINEHHTFARDPKEPIPFHANSPHINHIQVYCYRVVVDFKLEHHESSKKIIRFHRLVDKQAVY